MKNIQENVLKALNGVLPEDVVAKVSDVITSSLDEATKEIEADFQTQLDETYQEFRDATAKLQEKAYAGYSQAYQIICEMKDRLVLQAEENKRIMDEGFNEAWTMLQEERSKNDTLENDLHEVYEGKYGDLKKWLVKKMDRFIQTQGDKYYEEARKDLLNDPLFSEHRLAFQKILESAATILTDEDFAVATSSKVEALTKEKEELKKQLQMMESRNMRLSMEKHQLQDSVRRTKVNLLETASAEKVEKGAARKEERKQLIESAKKAQGRGKIEPNNDRQVVIGEYSNSGEPVAKGGDSLLEEAEEQVKACWAKLSGLEKSAEDEA